jgi:hypothetical protein
MRFSLDGSPAFDAWMQAALDALARDVRRALGDNLLALVLGGGYGRGEGGVCQHDGREAPYNDLDLFLVVRAPRRVPRDSLHALAVEHEARLGVAVDFSRPLTPRAIRALPTALMWHELLHGHLVLDGPPDVLTAHAPVALRGPLPPIEATRLLLNRGAGLLWALRLARGVEPPPDPDFARRNRFKCEQALGDAALIAFGRHHTRCAGRDLALVALAREVPGLDPLVPAERYALALSFKRRPDLVDPAQPEQAALADTAARWTALLLFLEARRTGHAFPSAASYASHRAPREPAPRCPWALAANLARGLSIGAPSLLHPRERLYRQLPLLLASPPPPAWAARSARFLATWRRFQ